ncbi:IS4 family transposase [Bradyrhizobium diversitatis]|uniref:IS4 family transposase n=1 Tax=Bradyrhizobium diversitatis TaxID=2755406 RepID=UPI0024BFF16E|nr:IS4 family transposase [Bradyrhizobium diversitatis]
MFCISWRVLRLTMLNRVAPEASPKLALTHTEIAMLDRLIGGASHRRCRPGTLASYLTKLARLAGYLARAGDPPPGNVVIWRGLSRLTDIELGAEIVAAGNVGN